MMKKFLSLALGLALCFGLAVPAFAAKAGSSATVGIQTRAESGIILEEKKDTLQIRYPTQGGGTWIYGEPQGADCSLHIVPTANEEYQITCTNLGPDETVNLYAWSDANGNGVYDSRIFQSRNQKWTDTEVLPIPQNGAYQFSGAYKTFATIEDLGLTVSQNGSVSISAGKLYELFGSNTFVEISVADAKTYDTQGKDYADFLLTGEKPQTVADIFTDVPIGNWVSDPVAWAVQNEITNGYGAKDKFAPAVECTEAQILTFLYRAVGDSSATVTNSMIMAVDKPYQSAVGWAYLRQMIDTDFKQDTPCTRAQAVKFIWEALGKPSATKTASFTDVPANADYAPAVSWAVEQGVTNGYGGNDTFAPDRVCNRGEILTFLYRAYNN